MSAELRDIRPLIHSGSDDLESFVAWSEQIKLEMSECNPLLYEVLGNIVFSRQPLAGGDSFKTRRAQASFSEERAHQQNLVEQPAREAIELQIRSEGRQLGCLLVQTTKGETQLRVTKWLSATNGWEVWRQLNLSFLSRLLASLLQISLDDEQPASCLQPVLAWKERVAEHQELFETCQKKQEELGEDNIVDHQANNSLQQEQEQDKPDKLVEGGQGGAYRPQPTAQRRKGEHQLPNSAHRACRDKPEAKGKGQESDPSLTKGKGQEPHPSLKQELEHRGRSGRQDQRKGKGEAYHPQPQAYKGKGNHSSFLHKNFGATYARRKGIEHKLAGGTTTSKSKSTKRRTLGAACAERSSFKETMETNLLLSGWLPTKVS